MIVTIEEDPTTGDLYLPIDDSVMDEMGWCVGDTIVWSENPDGSWSITKKEDRLDPVSEAVAQLWELGLQLKEENKKLRKELDDFKQLFIGDHK